MKKVLLATLGESPAVVTESIDKLSAEGIKIDIVTLLTTRDDDAQQSLELLDEHIPDYYKGKIEFHGAASARVINAYHDIDNDDAVVHFMRDACDALKSYRAKGWEVYVSIAGGRKAMSSLMTLAVQFYGATSLFHVLVTDKELEEKGNINRIISLPTDMWNSILHPPVDKIKLVRLPFIGLFPMIDKIISALNGNDPKDKNIVRLLEENGLLEGYQVTQFGRTVKKILEEVEMLPPPREGDCEISISKKEPKEVQMTKKWAERVCNRFYFVKKIEDMQWREGEPKVKIELPNKLIVSLPGRRVQGIIFKLTTTANTPGQLEKARQQVEKWIDNL